MSQFCKKCGSLLNSNSKFCGSCGTQQQAVEAPATDHKTMKMSGNFLLASATAGESTFPHVLPVAGNLSAEAGPIRVLFQSFLGLFRGFAAAFKNRKSWIPALILALVWFVLTLLPLLGVNLSPIRWLSFLTFAGGGTSGGITGLIGGVIGKGIFAYFLMSLVLPITLGQKPFAGVGNGLKQFFTAIKIKNPAQFAPLLAGMGIALVFYNFMTGNASLQNSMAGIAAFLLSLRALSQKTGFLQRFLGSLTAKKTPTRSFNSLGVNSIIAGLALGFAMSVPLSAINTVQFQLPYVLGALLMFTALILVFVLKPKKEVSV